MNRFKICLSCLCTLAFFPLGAERIEVVSNGTCKPEQLTSALLEKQWNGQVKECDFADYPGLVKDRTRFGKILRKLSLEPSSISVKEEVRKIIFMNIPPNGNRDLNLFKLPKEKMVLFMWEPPLRLRKMYSDKVQQCFARIYTWDDDLVDNQTYFKFYYPELRPMIENPVPFEKKQLCTMVIGNTSDKSYRSEELYSERKKTIAFFERMGERGFVFYGKNWEPAEYPSYRGPVADKIAVIKNYRFIICYENSKDLKGYITEKIFDCFAAGTVPIYWGASNVEEYIPKGCFIDRRDFQNLDELYLLLKNMQKEEYEGYLERIRAYLQSDRAQLFSYEHFQEIFHEACRS